MFFNKEIDKQRQPSRTEKLTVERLLLCLDCFWTLVDYRGDQRYDLWSGTNKEANSNHAKIANYFHARLFVLEKIITAKTYQEVIL